MTDKEKLDRLIAEIERRITFFKKQSVRKTTTDDNSCALALQGVLCFYDSMQEEPVSEGLDFIATRNALAYVNNINRGESPWLDSDMELAYEDGMKAGAKWKEQQMMKNVVLETEVLRDSDGDGVDAPYESWLTLANTEIPELPENLGLEEGDKVKILIVKSE